MSLFLVYLIGCLLGFGIICTFIIPYKKTDTVPSPISNFRLYIYGILCSWLTVGVFLFGIMRGVIKHGD